MLKIGDTIKCSDKNDLVDTMTNLARAGVETDFLYELDGQKGYWLIVEKVNDDYNTNI